MVVAGLFIALNISGWMAGPIIFGMIVDTACVVWSTSCSGKGACSLYDNDVFRVNLNLSTVIPRLTAIFLYCFVFYKARKKTDWSLDTADSINVSKHNAETDGMISGEDGDTVMPSNNWNSNVIYKGKQEPIFKGRQSTG